MRRKRMTGQKNRKSDTTCSFAQRFQMHWKDNLHNDRTWRADHQHVFRRWAASNLRHSTVIDGRTADSMISYRGRVETQVERRFRYWLLLIFLCSPVGPTTPSAYDHRSGRTLARLTNLSRQYLFSMLNPQAIFLCHVNDWDHLG